MSKYFFWQIIEEIDKVYFKEADFDCSEQELKVNLTTLSVFLMLISV